MNKNLGGDRLGSGAKNNVELHEWHKSTHDLGRTTRTTMSVGTLVPIYREFAQQGDSWEIDLDALVHTHPTEGPLFGSFKLQVDVFSAPIRLYQAKLHMNMLKQGSSMSDVKLPQIAIVAPPMDWTKTDINNQQINPSSIAAYLGIRGIGDTVGSWRWFNAVPFLTYYDIVAQYYANQQEEKMYIIHAGANINITEMAVAASGGTQLVAAAPTVTATPLIKDENPNITVQYSGELTPEGIEVNTNVGKFQLSKMFERSEVNGMNQITFSGLKQNWDGTVINNYETVRGTNGLPQMYGFDLSQINEMKMDILSAVKSTTAYNILPGTVIEPYRSILSGEHDYKAMQSSQEGLAVKTYQSDLFNNWLNSESVTNINNRAKVDTISGGFTMEAFLLMEKLYNYLNRIQLAGNTVDDWQEINWGKSKSTRIENPIYEGGLSKELVFDEVISNTATENQPLGTLAGRGRLNGKHKGGKVTIKVDEHSYIMVIASLTPRLDYYQGNKWDMNLKSLEDIHKPAFDRIGFQNLITDKMAWWDTKAIEGEATFRSAGKQPSWIDYQTNYNEVFGNFAIKDSEGWMVLTRDYEPNRTTKTIKDLTTYIDPAKWNDVFAYKARDAQNFWAQFKIDAKVRRVMSANQIPGL